MAQPNPATASPARSPKRHPQPARRALTARHHNTRSETPTGYPLLLLPSSLLTRPTHRFIVEYTNLFVIQKRSQGATSFVVTSFDAARNAHRR